MKKIGILTSGGDAPGMNACIRAAVRALAQGKAGYMVGEIVLTPLRDTWEKKKELDSGLLGLVRPLCA